jgi:hypothetical protein
VSFTQLDSQAKHAAQCLGSSQPFWVALREDEWSREQDEAKFTSEADFVKWLAADPFTADEILDIFYAIRRSFKDAKFNHAVDDGRKAAVGLYCLVACRLIGVESFEKNSKVVSINTGVSFLCAVIATTLFGGKILLRDADGSGCPRHEGTFHVDLAAAGDWSGFEIERAAYCAIYQVLESTDRVTLCSGQLGAAESGQLKARLKSLKKVDRISVALILSKPHATLNPTQFVQDYDVPLFMVSEGVDQALFGMSNDDFVAEVAEFWRDVHPDEKTGSSSPPKNQPQKENSVSHVHFHGPVHNPAITTGSHSNAVSGNNNTIQQNAPQGAQWEQVLAGLKELQALAQGLPDPKHQEKIEQKVVQAVEAAQSADKKPEEKAGLLKQAIEGIKNMAEMASSGEILVARCTQLLAVLASSLSSLGT